MTKVNVSSHIKSIEPYEGGLPIEEVARELNIPEQDIVKLASNENPLGISPLAKKAIEKSLIDIERYPDGNGFYLKRAISKKYKLQSSEIILGNGSNDVLELVARTFLSKDDEAIYSEHAFAVYPLVVQAVGAKGIEDIGNHIVPVQVAGHLAIDLRFGHLGMSNVIPRSRRQKPETENTIGLIGK